MSFYVIKASGDTELFSEKKFRTSLKRSGAEYTLIADLVAEVNRLQPKTTKEIYRYAMKRLKKERPPVAARYNLKQAIIALGPAGFPFEHFIEELYRRQGYTTKQGAIVTGKCINHEIDVVAKKDAAHYMIECKFHNRQALRTNSKVSLYIKARFDDVHAAWNTDKQDAHEFHKAVIVTNTKFTSVATEFAQCSGIQLISWSYPHKQSLPDLINKYHLHPITALPSLNKMQKETLVAKGFVLCEQASKYQKELHKLGFSESKIKKLVSESEEVCTIKEK